MSADAASRAQVSGARDSGAPDCVAGIGFRGAAGAGEVEALVRRALAAAGLPAARLRALATAADRAQEPPCTGAAAGLGVPVLALSPDRLRAVDAAVPTRSPRIEAARGVGSLAEAAALAGAGPGGRLVLARIADARVTCALALAQTSL